ncbi:hypothetical protein [Azospirillum sp. BE72]|uniref:hypothetical protein n=1 Tax=Azospirillum sp. BE72 TaxID=2817776 RepID=UPI00285A7690|nr:hypothetical protein [Azospirillum sp. BE72]MDR6770363.1 hypothetical protein [Azospirillum sp. BE72]
MARIRTIKPEFCTSEQVAECSPNARLLFVCMWCFCDDSGIHPDSAKRLKMEVFPADDFTAADVAAMVDELIAAGLLERYEVAGSSFLRVTGWRKHQKIDQPNYRHPLPGGEVPAAPSRRSGGNSPNAPKGDDERSTSVRRTGDDASANDHQTLDERSPPEGNGKERSREEKDSPPPTPASKARSPAAAAVVDAFVAAKDARWPEHAEQIAPRMTLEALAQQHLDAGGTVELLTEVIQRAVRDWKNPTPPTSLAALKNSLADRVAQHRRALDGGGGRSASGSAGDLLDVDPHDQSRQRLRHWVRTGWWEPRWGEMPGHRSCLIPDRVVREVIPDFKPGWRPPAAAANGAGGAA